VRWSKVTFGGSVRRGLGQCGAGAAAGGRQAIAALAWWPATPGGPRRPRGVGRPPATSAAIGGRDRGYVAITDAAGRPLPSRGLDHEHSHDCHHRSDHRCDRPADPAHLIASARLPPRVQAGMLPVRPPACPRQGSVL